MKKTEFFDPPRPRVFAHRGASGDYPENTLPAFAAARDVGTPYIELDVHMTGDGHVVVAHDNNLTRVAGADVLIPEMTLAELSHVDAGYNFTPSTSAAGEFPFRGRGIRVPELAEVFDACPEQRFIVEIKQTSPGLIDGLVGIIDRTGMRRRVLVASEHQAPIDEFRIAAPDIVVAAHKIGVEMHVWTIDEKAEMRAMLALRVDGIITDFPARLLKLIAPR
jgi:glycerophosphoryl diester phosphodiesterase